MGFLDTLSKLLERRRLRPTPDQLELRREVLQEAYYVAYYILNDSAMAKRVAPRALVGLMDKRDQLRHRVTNQGSYRHKVKRTKESPSRVRRVPLSFDLALACTIFSLTIEHEKAIAKGGQATRDDFDIWFSKCVMLTSLLGCNAFASLVGISNGIYSYTKDETMSLFYALVEAVPRHREPWEPGNEPYGTYLARLLRDIVERFGDDIQADNRGSLIRRPKSEQPQELVAECVAKFTLQEMRESCLKSKGQTGVDPSWSDAERELRRLHIVLDSACRLPTTRAFPPPEKRLGCRSTLSC